MFNHRVAYYSIETPQPVTLNYVIKILLSVFAKCGPPLFFMISGYLLLGRQESIKKIFTHRILRIVIVMAISAVYFVWRFRDMEDVHIKLNWYFFAYLGFLLLLPLLRKMVSAADRTIALYFLAISFTAYSFSGIYRMLSVPPTVKSGVETLLMSVFTAEWPSICWPIIFPLAGYFLADPGDKFFSKKEKDLLFIASAVLSLITCIVNVFQILWAVKTADPAYYTEVMRQYFAYAPSCFLFMLAGRISDLGKVKIGGKAAGLISALGAATFGMFVIETQTTFSLTIYGWIEDHTASVIGYYFPSLLSVAAEFIIYAAFICLLRCFKPVRKIL